MGLLCSIHEILGIYQTGHQGIVKAGVKSAQQRDAEQEEQSEDLMRLIAVLSNLMDQASQTRSTEIKDMAMPKMSEIIYFGLEGLCKLVSKDVLEVDQCRRKLLSLVSRLFETFPDLTVRFPPALVEWLTQVVLYGLDRTSIEDCREAIDSITFLCMYQYKRGLQSGFAPDDVLSQAIERFMDAILQLATFKQIDSQLLDSLGDCMFYLIILNRTKFETSMQSLIQHHAAQPMYVTRLQEGVDKILCCLDDMVKSNPRETWLLDQPEHMKHQKMNQIKMMHVFGNVLGKVLFDFRGFLLVR